MSQHAIYKLPPFGETAQESAAQYAAIECRKRKWVDEDQKQKQKGKGKGKGKGKVKVRSELDDGDEVTKLRLHRQNMGRTLETIGTLPALTVDKPNRE
ncbi:hypothetical protein MMC22_008507 [Lobaria immixta]|nr:hypothetical protein [Lobaria immixta]